MRPVNIPEDMTWVGSRKITVNPPPDDDGSLGEILPVEAIIDEAAPGVSRYHFMIKVDQLDLDQLKARGWFWLVMYGGVPPFDVAHPEVEELMDTP